MNRPCCPRQSRLLRIGLCASRRRFPPSPATLVGLLPVTTLPGCHSFFVLPPVFHLSIPRHPGRLFCPSSSTVLTATPPVSCELSSGAQTSPNTVHPSKQSLFPIRHRAPASSATTRRPLLSDALSAASYALLQPGQPRLSLPLLLVSLDHTTPVLGPPTPALTHHLSRTASGGKCNGYVCGSIAPHRKRKAVRLDGVYPPLRSHLEIRRVTAGWSTCLATPFHALRGLPSPHQRDLCLRYR